MPHTHPLIGEVWTTVDGLRDSVVVAVNTNAYAMLGRNGRVVYSPAQSFASLWKYTSPASEEPCSLGCGERSCVRDYRGARYCYQHAPKHQRLFFDGDTVEDPPSFEEDLCPSCGIPCADARPAWEQIETFIVQRCHCRARWIKLRGRGTSDDGVVLAEDIQAAYSILEHEFCSPIHVEADGISMSILRRYCEGTRANQNPVSLVSEGGRNFRAFGISIQEVPAREDSSILVYGTPSMANDEVQSFQQILLTCWRLRGDLYRVIAFQEALRDDRILLLNSTTDPSSYVQVSERELRAQGTQVEATAAVVVDGTDTMIVSPDDIVPSPAPDIPELGIWWHKESGDPVEVFGVGKGLDGAVFVRLSVASGVTTRMLVEDFLNLHSRPDGSFVVRVGDEYESIHGDLVVVLAVDTAFVYLQHEKQRLRVSIATFRSQYTRVIRRTALEILMGGEDLV